MFDNFRPFAQHTNGIVLRGVIGGEGPPLLLLHGYPQSHVMWHKVTPLLADKYQLVIPDLRGYGSSDKPDGGEGHINYSKRAMARDLVGLMNAFGHSRWAVCAHDRGARVAHRLAMDHPQAIERMMLLDISPTLTMYEQTSMEFAKAYWWWFFLIQPAPFPEGLILANPEHYLKKKIGYGAAGLTPFTDATYANYLKSISDAETVHAMCEDYRAAASIDLDHDRADRAAGRKIACPLRVLWGAHGVVNRCFKPLEDWAQVATQVSGEAVASGHYIAEEIPARLATEMEAFFPKVHN